MIERESNAICRFRQDNPPSSEVSLKTNSPIVKPARENLQSLQEKLRDIFTRYREIDLSFDYSKGSANYPYVLHVSILPPGQKVSNGIYVVICFDKLGRGALVGAAKSKTTPQNLDTIFRKTSNKDILQIDVDGKSSKTHYNNTFANPKEFYFSLDDDESLLAHIATSLDLVLYKLGFINGDKLTLPLQVKGEGLDAPFDSKNIEDARKKITTQINARQGQSIFRKELLEAYGARCAISGCNIQSLLEAAHILPYRGTHTNHIQNGIILRADLHTLFDLDLIKIDPSTYTVLLDHSIKNSEYSIYENKKILLPRITDFHPCKEALNWRLMENRL
ncbi:HNH endonuclease [Sphingobacterium psychroaquaticum]|uniref:HNH endonuclease n=1 Tax=Sphingobacterium psychroaquaticum TaxID=561061 RepID=A0A1X7KTU2_9SPHI|nr:HNH endonuclease [Sphingobacterium psychroaquaticum]SMG44680.1 HNH endonuclease [Sphingobacterium psychroaquaticum]